MFITPMMGTIVNVYYRGTEKGDVVRVEVDTPSEIALIDIPNTGWSVDNPSLMFMAYLGVSPSTLSEAIGKEIPVVMTTDYEIDIHPSVWTYGQRALIASGMFD